MKIAITLSEALYRVSNWSEFCSQVGVSEYCVNEGFGHTTVELSLEQAIEFGLVKGE